jgi:hypothetical protein
MNYIFNKEMKKRNISMRSGGSISPEGNSVVSLDLSKNMRTIE